MLCSELPSVNYLEVSEFHKVCMFGISYSDDCMNFFNKLLFLLILFKDYLVSIVTLPFTKYTSKCMYHLASLVLPARFWIIINLIPILDLEIHLYSYLRYSMQNTITHTDDHMLPGTKVFESVRAAFLFLCCRLSISFCFPGFFLESRIDIFSNSTSVDLLLFFLGFRNLF